jgi:hypothetical protein
MPGGVTLWKLIRVLGGGGGLLETTLAPVLPSEQLDLNLLVASYSRGFFCLPEVVAASHVPGVDGATQPWQEVLPR